MAHLQLPLPCLSLSCELEEEKNTCVKHSSIEQKFEETKNNKYYAN
jgi:hypothetical protein